MFFRRERPRVPTFDQRVEALRRASFTIESDGSGVRVSRDGCAAVIEDRGAPHPFVNQAGWVIGGKICALVDEGYQKFWLVPDGRKVPALAHQLSALHRFEEDLREALGLESLYNEALGTVNDLHMYDRVVGRDRGVVRPWDK